MGQSKVSVRVCAAVVFAVAIAAGGLLSAQSAPSPSVHPPYAVTGACHVSPIVDDLDRSARFYHDLIGLDLVPTPPAGPLPWDEDPGHLHLHGMPEARLRFIGARMPGIRCGVELVEMRGIDRTPVRRRIQDPGAVTLILLVRDLDAAFAKLKAAGVPVVSIGGAPVSMSATSRTRAIIVQDPDGHFVELAQLDPLPETSAPTSSNVIGIRLRVTVSDMDGTLAFYQRRLDLKGDLRAFTASPQVSAMLGLRDVEYRMATVRMPNSPLILEFMELKGAPGVATRSRVQDPGSFRLQLNVRDIDAALAGITASGGRVISSNRAPVSMTFGSRPWRLAIAPDPNNLFLVVQQPPPPAVGRPVAAGPAPARSGAAAGGRRRQVRAPRRRDRQGPACRATTRATQHGRPGARRDWTSPTSAACRRVGEGHSQAAVRARCRRRACRGRTRPRQASSSWLGDRLDRAAAASPSRAARPASPEPRGVRQRRPRPAGARRRRRGAAAARRLELRLRQHRRRAGRVAVAAGALPRRRPADQRAGRRRPGDRRRSTRPTASAPI